MASWSHSDIAEFIEIYRSEECLWKIKSPLYSNRLYKERAYKRLLKFVRTFDREATKETIVKKINTLRTSFRKELKKVKSSTLSGSGANEVYIPKLWYFNDLLFLQEQEQSRVACSSLERSSQVQEDTWEGRISVAEPVDDLSKYFDVADSGPTLETRTEPRSEQSNITRNRTGSKRKSEDDELLKIMRQRLLSPAPAMPKEDQFDAFGKLMAHKMRNLPHDQRVIAERLCHDVMLDAELGNLSRQTRLVNQSTHYEGRLLNHFHVIPRQADAEM